MMYSGLMLSKEALPRTGEGLGGGERHSGGPAEASATPKAVALVMAGGTGGHIFPGLAVAEALRARGWRVHWLGAPESMEHRLVPPRGFEFEAVAFGGVRGKGR